MITCHRSPISMSILQPVFDGLYIAFGNFVITPVGGDHT